jgi:uncharacterized protein
LNLFPDGSGRVITIGNDLINGIWPQVAVPQGVWQGAKLQRSGKFALLGTTVAPGFEYPNFELGHRDELIKLYPKYREMIISLTKPT